MIVQDQLAEIITKVGREIKKNRSLAGDSKWDGDQLKTKADIFAHTILKYELLSLQKIPIISEEDVETHLIYRPDKYWIIDPIDGTRSFADGYPSWVTQVALVENGVVVNAAIYAPDLDLLYLASLGNGAFLNGDRIIVKNSDMNQIRLIDNYPEPRGIAEKMMKMIPCKSYIESGSISLKICWIADGSADLFVKDVTIRDWDVAAPMLVLEEAKGILRTGYGKTFLLSNNFDKFGLVVSSSKKVKNMAVDIMNNLY